MVAATGALRCLRHRFADAHISLLLKPSLAPLLEDAPWFDAIVPYDRAAATPNQRRDMLRQLRLARFDMAVLLTHGISGAWFLWRAGIPRRLGLSKRSFGLFLTDHVSLRKLRAGRPYVSKVEVYSALCALAGCGDASDLRPELRVGGELQRRADEALEAAGARPERALVAVAPGASYGPSKLWPAERFGAVASGLMQDPGCDVVLLTSPAEAEIAQAVTRAMPRPPIQLPPSTGGLAMLKAIVRRASLLVGNDSGPRHVAIAFGVPVVTIMGPTDPRVTESPYEKGVVLRHEAPCGPCYLRECPRDHACMNSVTVDEVLRAARRFIAPPRRG